MESPNRSRALLALVIVVACSVWLSTGHSRASKASVAVQHVDLMPRVDNKGLQPAHQSVALGALNRTAPVLGE